MARVARSLGDLGDVWEGWTSRGVELLSEPGEPHRLPDLRASVEASLRSPQITGRARRLVGLLSFLPDGIARRDAAELGVSDREISELRDLDLDDANPGRVRLLAIVRDHVTRASWPQPEELPRVIQFYASLVGEIGPRVGEPGSDAALSRLDGEFHNIEAMLALGLGAPDPRLAIEAALALERYLVIRRTASARILEQAADAARRLGDGRAQARCLDALGEVALSRNDPKAAEFWSRAVILYRDQEDTAEALRIDERVLRISEAAKGPDHPDTLAMRLGVADLIRERGDAGEALQRYRGLLPDLVRVFGPADRLTLGARLRIADTVLALGARQEALQLYSDLLPELARTLGEHDPATRVARFSIAALTDPDGVSTTPTAAPTTTVTLGLQSSPAMALAMVARDRGLFPDIGVDLRPFDAGKVALRAFLAGWVDYAISGEVPVALAILRGSYTRAHDDRAAATPKVVAQVVERTVDEVRIVARRDGNLVTPVDYFRERPRKLATSFGGGPEFFAYSFLKRRGIDPINEKEVKLLNWDPADMPRALAEGEVDAIAIFDPFAFRAQRLLGDRALVLSETDPQGYAQLYVLNADLGPNRQAARTIAALVKGFTLATDFIRDEPAAARAIIRRYTGLDDASIEAILTSFRWGTRLTPELLRVWEQQGQWAEETGKVVKGTAASVRFADFVDRGFSESAAS
jgi:NitT/TauT family transport system substrate-binding protein